MSVPSLPLADDISALSLLDFEIMREDWSVYKLEDGNKIRARAIIVSIRGPRIPPQKGDQITPETQVIVKVDSPPNRRGTKGSPATPEELNDPRGHGGVDIGITVSSEPWNEYHISGTNLRLRTKLVLNHAWRIDERYDNIGDPVYVVNFTIIPTVES